GYLLNALPYEDVRRSLVSAGSWLQGRFAGMFKERMMVSSLLRSPMRRFALLASVAAMLLAAVFVPALLNKPTAEQAAPSTALTSPNFGSNVYIFNPSMPQSQIQATVDSIAAQQVPNQFGTQRYALLFAPGTYGSSATPLNFQVGYYTSVAGLGQ